MNGSASRIVNEVFTMGTVSAGIQCTKRVDRSSAVGTDSVDDIRGISSADFPFSMTVMDVTSPGVAFDR